MNIHNCDLIAFLHITNIIFSKPLSLPTWNNLVKKKTLANTHLSWNSDGNLNLTVSGPSIQFKTFCKSEQLSLSAKPMCK